MFLFYRLIEVILCMVTALTYGVHDHDQDCMPGSVLIHPAMDVLMINNI